jgi:hypothetical protein
LQDRKNHRFDTVLPETKQRLDKVTATLGLDSSSSYIESATLAHLEKDDKRLAVADG